MLLTKDLNVINALLFDIGGTNIRSGELVDSGNVTNIQSKRIPGELSNNTREDIWQFLLAYISSISKATSIEKSHPIVISFPGPIGSNNRILSAPTLVGKTECYPDLAEEIKDKTGRKTYILNDISAAAWYLSTISGVSRFMVVTVSSGIGSKIYDKENRLGVLDSLPYSGEIGHIKVDLSKDALVCDCGERGHLGAIASGRGIERTVNAFAEKEQNSFSRSLCHTQFGAVPGKIRNEDHIVPAAKMGDEWIIRNITHCTSYLSNVLSTAFMAYGLEKIFVIGGFANALSEIYLNIIKNQFTEHTRYHLIPENIHEAIELKVEHEHAPLYGAAQYALFLSKVSE